MADLELGDASLSMAPGGHVSHPRARSQDDLAFKNHSLQSLPQSRRANGTGIAGAQKAEAGTRVLQPGGGHCGTEGRRRVHGSIAGKAVGIGLAVLWPR